MSTRKVDCSMAIATKLITTESFRARIRTVGSDGVFYADQIMAKHDENYMPPEAAKALEQGKDINKIKNSANEAAKTLSR